MTIKGLQQIAPRPCEINGCANLASWTYNNTAVCEQDLQEMACMNSDNAQAFAPALPGMTVEEYAKGWAEEMSHISFVLEYNFLRHTCTTLPTLSELIRKYVPIATPDQCQEYFIHILKEGKEVGRGWYKRTWDNLEINETGAAQGLSDALYEHTFRNV